MALLETSKHAGGTYPLATEKLSLVVMAEIARELCGFDVKARRLSSEEFAHIALSPIARQGKGRFRWGYTSSDCGPQHQFHQNG